MRATSKRQDHSRTDLDRGVLNDKPSGRYDSRRVLPRRVPQTLRERLMRPVPSWRAPTFSTKSRGGLRSFRQGPVVYFLHACGDPPITGS
jgi:hypothetical protein